MQNNYLTIETYIKYKFKDRRYLVLALTHPSYANENNIEKFMTNQRLEFLGDAVLELVSSDFLYKKYSEYDEGKLTKIRSNIVCEDSLADISRELKLYEFLRLGKGENKDKVKENNSIMCDALEAIIGAIYLDNGIFDASNFILNFVLTEKNLNKQNSDYKSELQEYANSKAACLKYIVTNEIGPDHDKEFEINLVFDGEVLGTGFGKSKKEAEQNAAKIALKKLAEGN